MLTEREEGGQEGPAPPPNTLWGEDWPEVVALWTLDPTVTFLNHGSFGATPRPVLEEQARWRAEMEAEPVRFLWRRLPSLVEEARTVVAAYLDADEEGLAFVRNATSGVATVLASLDLRAGDRLVATDHVYPAVFNALARRCGQAGAEMALASIPLDADTDVAVACLDRALDERTRLVVVEHVTSATARLFPVGELVGLCRRRGVPVMVDGAHAPGMVDVSVRSLAPDYWTGNFHKWVCAPKGSAGLWVAPEHRERVHPLVTSHGAGRGFLAEFDYVGTDDPSAYLSVPAAIAFLAALGEDRVRAYDRALAEEGQGRACRALGTVPPAAGSCSMALVPVPVGVAPDAAAAESLQRRLFDEHRIEVPAYWWNGAPYLRLSAQVYNHPREYERLASALASERARSG